MKTDFKNFLNHRFLFILGGGGGPSILMYINVYVYFGFFM